MGTGFAEAPHPGVTASAGFEGRTVRSVSFGRVFVRMIRTLQGEPGEQADQSQVPTLTAQTGRVAKAEGAMTPGAFRCG